MRGRGAEKPAYLDPNLPADQRAADLVQRMTLGEKRAARESGARHSAAKVPAYDWWSEALHGVAVNGTTEFPEPVGLGRHLRRAGHSRDGRGYQH